MDLLTELDLFAGIGGIALGLKRAGLCRTVVYVENDPYAQKVLQARMQDGQLDDAPIWDDVCTFDGHPWQGMVDLVAGGFPCQDISVAGKGEGIEGSRSGLWGQMRRIICEVRPRVVLVENVPALLGRGLGRVLGDLAASGFDAEWDCLSAQQFGAPHIRERIWIVANDRSQRIEGRGKIEVQRQSAFSWCENVRGASELPSRSDLYPSQLCRSCNGISERLDRLGNAVVPQVVEWIGRRIKEALK